MIVQHYKGGWYRVLFQALDSTNGRPRDPLVVYVSLDRGSINVRPQREFDEPVLWPDGVRRARFLPTTEFAYRSAKEAL